MILFTLKCGAGHDFEAWFRNGAAYESRDHGAIACPVCGDTRVSKAPMAPRINRGRAAPTDESRREASSAPAPAPVAGGAAGAEGQDADTAGGVAGGSGQAAPVSSSQELMLHQQGALMREMRALCRHVESHCTYVGGRFAEEARRIHYGEVEARDIYGETSPAEAAELQDEGIAFHQIPWIPGTNS